MSAWRGFTAPYRALNGEFEAAIDPETGSIYYPEMIEAAMDIAGIMAPGSIAANSAKPLAAIAKAPQNAFASKSAGMYNPPVKPPRPFEADYPAGAAADAHGRLIRDIEGRPLGARYVVGRTQAGGSDVALPREALDEIAKTGTGYGVRPAKTWPGRRNADVGGVVVNRYSGKPENVFVSENLTPQQFERVSGHEIGHVIDEMSGRIDVRGLDTELRRLYNTLNTGRGRTRNLTGPQHLGYKALKFPANSWLKPSAPIWPTRTTSRP